MSAYACLYPSLPMAQSQVCCQPLHEDLCFEWWHIQRCYSAMICLQAGISRQDAIAAIRKDYDSNYFVSGQGKRCILPSNTPRI